MCYFRVSSVSNSSSCASLFTPPPPPPTHTHKNTSSSSVSGMAIQEAFSGIVEERRKRKREKKSPGNASSGSEKGKIVWPREWLVTPSKRKWGKWPCHVIWSLSSHWGSQLLDTRLFSDNIWNDEVLRRCRWPLTLGEILGEKKTLQKKKEELCWEY